MVEFLSYYLQSGPLQPPLGLVGGGDSSANARGVVNASRAINAIMATVTRFIEVPPYTNG
jgi:hypothetical protein